MIILEREWDKWKKNKATVWNDGSSKPSGEASISHEDIWAATSGEDNALRSIVDESN